MKNIVKTPIFLFAILLIVKLSSAQITLTLQPNAQDGKDAGVSSLFPTNNYANVDELTAMAWTSSGSFNIGRTFIDFDLSSIPTNAVIQSAILSLYSPQVSTKNPMLHNNYPNSPYPLSNESYIQLVTSPWTENTLTWNNQPSTTNVNQVQVAATNTNAQDFQIPITALVQDYVSNPSTSFGFTHRLQIEGFYRSLIFSSSDHANPALHPKLEVTYNYPLSTTTVHDKSALVIYPNPANNVLNIKNAGEQSTISIYSVLGNKFHRIDNLKSVTKVNISDWAVGTYIVQTIDKNGVKTSSQFLKQ